MTQRLRDLDHQPIDDKADRNERRKTCEADWPEMIREGDGGSRGRNDADAAKDEELQVLMDFVILIGHMRSQR
ncbi:MAG: hypothetical protein JO353_02935 [Phycisphaerae bacterium]|nr:hypothetical protein [Phycisphaerae bacterium]